MADTPRLTHAGSGNDHLRFAVKVDHLGFFTGNGTLQPRERDRVDPLLHQRHRLFIKTGFNIPVEDLRSVHSQRTVYIYREIRMVFYHFIRLDLAQEIKQFLSPANRKGRDHHISASVKSLLNDLRKLAHIIRFCIGMEPVAVGGLHYHIIRFFRISRIADKRLIQISDISGKYDLL